MKNFLNQKLIMSISVILTSCLISIGAVCQTPTAPVTPPGSPVPPTSVPNLTPASVPGQTTLPGQPAPMPGTTTPPGQNNPANTIPNGSAPSVSPNPNSAYPNGGADTSKVQFVPNQNYLQPANPMQTSPVTPMDTSGNQPHH